MVLGITTECLGRRHTSTSTRTTSSFLSTRSDARIRGFVGYEETHKRRENSAQSWETRIAGGSEAKANEYPFMASSDSEFLCGATLIWPDILLSAATCKISFQSGTVAVSGISADGTDSTAHSVGRLLIHPDFQYDGSDARAPLNDIMLVKLLTRSTAIPVDISRDLPVNGETVKALGFGDYRRWIAAVFFDGSEFECY